MTNKKSFWCMTCRQDKPIGEKSARKVKPPYVCQKCDAALAEKRRESFTAPRKAADPSRAGYLSGRTARFFKGK